MTNEDLLPQSLFARVDETADALFYQAPRLVTHIDDATIAALTEHYRTFLPDGVDVLDLMSSWISHLPPEKTLGRVSGLGMNEQELATNSRLSEFVVQDLNRNPHLPYLDATFDRAMIVVSIQYLIDPVAVFAEVGRVLRIGGQLLVAMSHRCFPTKAIRAFHVLSAQDRVRLVSECFTRAGCYGDITFIDRSPANADPLWIVTGTRTA